MAFDTFFSFLYFNNQLNLFRYLNKADLKIVSIYLNRKRRLMLEQ